MTDIQKLNDRLDEIEQLVIVSQQLTDKIAFQLSEIESMLATTVEDIIDRLDSPSSPTSEAFHATSVKDLMIMGKRELAISLLFLSEIEKCYTINDIQKIVPRHASQITRVLSYLMESNLLGRRKGDKRKDENPRVYYYFVLPHIFSIFENADSEVLEILKMRAREASEFLMNVEEIISKLPK